jgi:sugar/nucleoside kinase (ribokinase family)
MSRLVQLSGVVIDHVYRLRAVPAPGTEAEVRSATLSPGGGFNAMVAARRMGLDVAYGGTLGTGAFADLAAGAMQGQGITVLRPRLQGMDQGCCTVMIDDQGERTFLYAEGADGVVSDADLAGLRLARDDWCLLSGYALFYRASRWALVRWLGAGGHRLVFDPSTVVAMVPEEARKAALVAAHWVSANRAEAEVLTGRADPASAAAALSQRPGGAVVRDGARGAWVAVAGEAPVHVPPLPVRSIDTNGAGDTHVGAFIAGLALGRSPVESCRLANIAAALSTTREGPATAPELTEVLAHAARTIQQET